MQTRSKPVSHLQELDRKVKLSQSSSTLGGGPKVPGENVLPQSELSKK